MITSQLQLDIGMSRQQTIQIFEGTSWICLTINVLKYSSFVYIRFVVFLVTYCNNYDMIVCEWNAKIGWLRAMQGYDAFDAFNSIFDGNEKTRKRELKASDNYSTVVYVIFDVCRVYKCRNKHYLKELIAIWISEWFSVKMIFMKSVGSTAETQW